MVRPLSVRNSGHKQSLLMTFNGCGSNIICHFIGQMNYKAMIIKDNIEQGIGMHSA